MFPKVFKRRRCTVATNRKDTWIGRENSLFLPVPARKLGLKDIINDVNKAIGALNISGNELGVVHQGLALSFRKDVSFLTASMMSCITFSFTLETCQHRFQLATYTYYF